jgi:hypothetical protein
MLDRFIEVQGWGMNWLTASFIVTLLFDGIEAWEVAAQQRTIKTLGKAESVSVSWFCYFGFLLIALGVYGVIEDPKQISIALIGEGILGLCFYLPMMHALRTVKGYSRNEKWVFISSLAMVPIILLLPGKEFLMTMFCGGAVCALSTMPWEIWKNKNRGQVKLGLTIIYLANVIGWTVYGFKARILPLMIVTPVSILLLLITILFWCVYTDKQESGSTDGSRVPNQ